MIVDEVIVTGYSEDGAVIKIEYAGTRSNEIDYRLEAFELYTMMAEHLPGKTFAMLSKLFAVDY